MEEPDRCQTKIHRNRKKIKIKHVKKNDVLLTIHVYLTTSLIHCKGKLFHEFVDNIFPVIKQSVQAERENGGSGENTLGPTAATQDVDGSTENKNNQQSANLDQSAIQQLSKINFLNFCMTSKVSRTKSSKDIQTYRQDRHILRRMWPPDWRKPRKKWQPC